METEIIVALIGAGGVVVTGIIALVGFLININLNKKNNYGLYVSKSRNEWLNELRNSVTTMIAANKCTNAFKKNSKNYDHYLFEFEKAKADILVRLNLYEELHKELYGQLKAKNNKFNEDIITEKVRNIIKEEWEKVKSEAKGDIDYE